jgi:AraC family transcriptional regulator, transcriptional activator of the genes for pyochelin and ferripyochelin receptors
MNMGFNNITYLLPLAFNLLAKTELERINPVLGFALLTHTTYSDDILMVEGTLPVVHCNEFLGLHFNLGTALQYKVHKMEGTIRSNQFSLFSIPPTACEYKVTKGRYRSFSIHFPIAYLQLLEMHFPLQLVNLLKDSGLKIPAAASMTPTNCTPEIIRIIRNILYCTGFKDVSRDAYLNSIVFDLLLNCLEFLKKSLHELPFVKKAARLPEGDVRKIVEAHAYLKEHLQDHFSPDLLAGRVDLDLYKLRKGFKAHYKTTMMDFLIEERMTKARNLLSNSKIPIKEIAFSVGYERPSLFTSFFTKKYGYPPSTLRSKPPEDSGGEKIEVLVK